MAEEVQAPIQPPPAASAPVPRNNVLAREEDLFRRTLRMVAILVGACVLFVGALSVVAVAITSRAVGGGAAEARSPDTTTDKKPLSI
ncbi:MAG: hypothetical protein KF819_31530 [Labilithrix sp.]|nr:hypothetical protein [Labilithrix sp.]